MSTPVVILAGGRGARFDHESQVLPKPLIEAAGKPMLGHIMDIFEAQGFDEFIVLGGYLVDRVRDYVASRYECRAFPSAQHPIEAFGNKGQKVKTLVMDTGLDSTTGDRLMKMSLEFLPMPLQSRNFFLTYGDGVADVDLHELLRFHEDEYHPKAPAITVTAVRPPGRFGVIELGGEDGFVRSFGEKPADSWINGGFMVLDHGSIMRLVPEKIDSYLNYTTPMQSFESGALVRAAQQGRLRAFKHGGYWRCMDTRRDLEQIEADVAANGGKMPWMRSER